MHVAGNGWARARWFVAVTSVAALSLVGCGGDDPAAAGDASAGAGGGATGATGAGGAAGPGGGDTGGTAFVPAEHTPLPLLRDHGQGVYDHLELITITFPDYIHKDDVETFGDWLVRSDYYAQMGAEYGVGPGTHLAKVVLPDDPPQSDHALLTLLGERIDDGTLPNPADHPQALYAVYFPPDATFDGGGPLCGASLAYHAASQHAGNHYAYSVIGDCGSDPNYGAVSNASHEIIEVATDPFNAWYVQPKATDPWFYMYDDEIADMCEYFQVATVEGFPVTRWWSNAAAKASQNPCLPVPEGLELYRLVTASPATVVNVTPGESTTFTLTGWSTGPQAPWKIFAEPEPSYSEFHGMTVSLDKKIVGNGDTATLTVNVPADAKSNRVGVVGIYSDPGFAQAWYVAVKTN